MTTHVLEIPASQSLSTADMAHLLQRVDQIRRLCRANYVDGSLQLVQLCNEHPDQEELIRAAMKGE